MKKKHIVNLEGYSKDRILSKSDFERILQYNNIARREKKYADYLYMGWAREDCSYTGCTKILGPIIVIISLSLCVLGMVWFF